jgi:xylan 1,4-beta-xylosidase
MKPPTDHVASLAYRNPVIRGFAPDPSVVRVGADYFVAHSTFQYFPAVRLSHSRDLVHWKPIGYVFDRVESLDLRSYFDGCGVWAPDLSYHDGWFYLFYCLVQLTRDRSVNVRGNYMVRSRTIHGPWSQPIQLTDEGNDPSHFVDEDGRHYMLYAPGMRLERGTKIVRLSDECDRVVGESHWMRWGTDRTAPEGPHVFKRNGWYYHTMAAGSGLYAGHHQLIARSRHLLGDYEPSPHGPFIAQHDANSPLQSHGHAKMVEDPAGQWWAMYLCQRKIEGVSPLGRETGLDRVDWLADGWPVLNSGRGPSEASSLSAEVSLDHAHDEFDAPSLSANWQWLRCPGVADLLTRRGWLRLALDRHSLHDLQCHGVLLQRETSHHYTAQTRMSFDSTRGGVAGLVCYYDAACHITIGVRWINGPTLILEERRRGVSSVLARVPVRAGEFFLRVRVAGLRRSFYFSTDGNAWTHVGSIDRCDFLSDEGTPNWGFSGTMVGVFASEDASCNAGYAEFDGFTRTDDAEVP